MDCQEDDVQGRKGMDAANGRQLIGSHQIQNGVDQW